MIIFAVQVIREFNTRQRVCKLIRGDKCLLDKFESEIGKDNNLNPEIDELFATLEDVANGKLVPKNRYRKLESGKLKYNLYEVKSKNLRLYLFHDKENGQILVIGGKKSNQSQDIERVKRIVKEYTEFTNKHRQT